MPDSDAARTGNHVVTYEDPVTKKHRQYDVRAWAERRQQRLDLAIECKALRPWFPLVVSRIPRAADESFHHLILSHTREPDPGEVYSRIDLDRARTLPMEGRYSIYGQGEPVGKSTTQEGGTTRASSSRGMAKPSTSGPKRSPPPTVVNGASGAHERYGTPRSSPPSCRCWLFRMARVGGRLRRGRPSAGSVVGQPGDVVRKAHVLSTFDDACVLSHLQIYTRTGIEAFLDTIAHSKADFWEPVSQARDRAGDGLLLTAVDLTVECLPCAGFAGNERVSNVASLDPIRFASEDYLSVLIAQSYI